MLFPEEKRILNTLEDFPRDVSHLLKNPGKGNFKKPAIFYDWAFKFSDLLYYGVTPNRHGKCLSRIRP